jgi:predicted DNA-binding transcriptional regulator YafY
VTAASAERLSRLLAMVPWLLRRQGVGLDEAARHFDISQTQLVRDLELLFVCGTPGHLPDDLIEADWESGQVFLGNADPIAKPLRLSVDEAVALLAGLRTLAQVPGLHERSALESALTKLSAAAGDAGSAASAVSATLAPSAQESVLAAAREALQRHRRLHLRYLVPSRDEATERDVDPMRVLNAGDRWYLEGWCHRSEAVRLFRLDRIVQIEVLDVDGRPPRDAVRRDVDERLFTPSPEDVVVTLDVEPEAHWVATYYPAENVADLGDGRLRVTLRAASPDWVPRLALRLGGALRVLTPGGLAEEVRSRATAALAAYPEASPNG